jgi:hypothetical protein
VADRENRQQVEPPDVTGGETQRAGSGANAKADNGTVDESRHTIKVDLPPLPGLSSEMALQFQQIVQTFVDDISQEVARIEEGNRAGGEAQPGSSASTILQAYQLVKRPPVSAPRQASKFTWTVRVVQPISALGTGIMLTLLHSAWQASLCTACALLFLMTTGMLLRGEVR